MGAELITTVLTAKLYRLGKNSLPTIGVAYILCNSVARSAGKI